MIITRIVRWQRVRWRPACTTNASWEYWLARSRYELTGSQHALSQMLGKVGLSQPDLDNIAARPTRAGSDTCPHPEHYRPAAASNWQWSRKRPVWHPAGYCDLAVTAASCGLRDDDTPHPGACTCTECYDTRIMQAGRRELERLAGRREQERLERERLERDREIAGAHRLAAIDFAEARQVRTHHQTVPEYARMMGSHRIP